MTQKPHESMSDLEFIEHFMEVGVDGIIAEREERGRRLAERFQDLRGLEFGIFLQRLDDLGVALDFVTKYALYNTINESR